MAKAKTQNVKIVRVPSFSPATKAKVAGLAKRGASAAAKAALEEKHTLAAIVAAGALGYVESRNVAVPKIDALGVGGTYGTAAWVLGRYMKSNTMQHVATGLLSCAMRDLVARTGVTAPGPVRGDEFAGEF